MCECVCVNKLLGDISNIVATCNGCNMGTRDLPDMYARARGLREYISGKSQENMLQVICITSDCGFWI